LISLRANCLVVVQWRRGRSGTHGMASTKARDLATSGHLARLVLTRETRLVSRRAKPGGVSVPDSVSSELPSRLLRQVTQPSYTRGPYTR
jgi:hypothetical protein